MYVEYLISMHFVFYSSTTCWQTLNVIVYNAQNGYTAVSIEGNAFFFDPTILVYVVAP